MTGRPLRAATAGIAVAVLAFAMPAPAAACERTPREDYNPTGWEGCTAYGSGLASRWQGPGVAVNSCLWPWTACDPITITALDTGRSITVRPTMFCDCWHRTARMKLVDLPPAIVTRLGLAWADGVYRVRVEPAALLPDTAVAE